MRVAVFGATGGIGYSTVLEAQKAGHAVRALVRNPRKLPFPDGVEVVVGDATDPATVTLPELPAPEVACAPKLLAWASSGTRTLTLSVFPVMLVLPLIKARLSRLA